MTARSVALHTLGCRLNQAESEEILDALARQGFQIAGRPGPDGVAPADVVVVNTCTVTRESTRSSRQLINRAVRQHPDATVVVTGCYAVAEPAAVAAIPGVDLVVANKDKAILAERLAGLVSSPIDGEPVVLAPRRAEARTSLKVQTGCDEACTFCIVPATRGGLDSVDADEIVARAGDLVARGAGEIVVTGVHLARYGADQGSSCATGASGSRGPLAELLERLLAVDGIVRVRLSSIEAAHLPDAVIDLMRDEPRLAPHLHLPLQSGSPAVFARMRRPGSLDRHVAVAERALSEVPGLALTTDVLVGFPGETDAEFAETVALIERLRYAKLHVFRFSGRDGTPASTMDGQVPDAVVRRRAAALRLLGDRMRLEFVADQCRRGPLEVLVEEARPGPTAPTLRGTTGNFVRVDAPGPAGLIGRLVRVVAEEATITADGVAGVLVDHPGDDRSQREFAELLDMSRPGVEYAGPR